MPQVKLILLGTPRLERAGRAVTVDTRKAIALLAYLALADGPLSRERLAGVLWPDSDNTRALGALRRTLSALNTALRGDGLDIEREAVGLNAEQMWVDVLAFQSAVKQKRLEEAASLYHDDFMAGFSLKDSPPFDDWQFFQTETLRRQLAEALEMLVAAQSARQPKAALLHARRWLSLDTLHEPAHRALMQLYAATGQHTAALRQYQECARVLEAELGVRPVAETTALLDAIKRRRGAPDHPPRPPAPAAVRPAPAAAPLPLVGRATELAALTASLRAGQLILLEGEAGIGKTRLAEALHAHAAAQGALVLSARCYPGQSRLTYGPLVEAVRAALADPAQADLLAALPPHHRLEAARLWPELAPASATPPSTPDGPGAQSRFFEGIRQVLDALTRPTSPGLLIIDDVHWADDATLDLLGYLTRRLAEMPLAIALAWRSEDVGAAHPLRALASEAARGQAVHRLALGRLPPEAVHAWVAEARPEAARQPGFVERLYRESEGSPFFIAEYLRAWPPVGEPDWALPQGVRALLNTRLTAVGDLAGQVLAAAAVLGRSFTFEILHATSGRGEEETVDALEALTAHGLVTEAAGPTPRFDFNHDKLRELVYEQTSLMRRRLLHRRAAEALTALSRRLPGPSLSAQIAQHYRLGGEEAQAAAHFQLAGDHARAVYANAEARSHYTTALALGHPEPALLHEALGDLLTRAGDYTGALRSYESAAATASAAALARLEHRLAEVYDRRGEWDLAELHFQNAAHGLAEAGPAVARARLLADWSRSAHHQGEDARAAELAQTALGLATQAADPRALAQAHNCLGLILSRAGRGADAQAHFEHSLRLAGGLDDPDAQIAALNNLALVCREAGDLARAAELTEAALAQCSAIGDRHREAALLNNLADLRYAQGQTEAAMRLLKRAVTTFAEIGGEAARTQPEIWKLTEW